eukprot:scaffold1564_cov239-Chaetoceros_neogracile.AAC.3
MNNLKEAPPAIAANHDIEIGGPSGLVAHRVYQNRTALVKTAVVGYFIKGLVVIAWFGHVCTLLGVGTDLGTDPTVLVVAGLITCVNNSFKRKSRREYFRGHKTKQTRSGS